MKGVYRMLVCGNVAGSPFFQKLKEGNEVCNVTIAVNRDFYDDSTGEKVEVNPHWVSLEFWGSKAKRASDIIQKGDIIIAEGTPGSYIYDKEKEPESRVTCKVSDFFVSKHPKNNKEK